MRNKGKIITIKLLKYSWQCPYCSDAGVTSADRSTVEYCRKIHQCGKLTEEDK